jgi:hypothetical protein
MSHELVVFEHDDEQCLDYFRLATMVGQRALIRCGAGNAPYAVNIVNKYRRSDMITSQAGLNGSEPQCQDRSKMTPMFWQQAPPHMSVFRDPYRAINRGWRQAPVAPNQPVLLDALRLRDRLVVTR